jgi:hypothetical protein
MNWQLALAQHPMYLLIREDTQCAERTPPWGAPTIEAYIDRVRQNLESLEHYPQLQLGYEWSGVELELLAQDAPEIFEQMRGYAAAGRLSFYNGTYAQPHLQILSAEASLRQFAFGRQIYQDLGLPPVTVYAHQEASLHDQTPQLLRAFGYAFAVVPGFMTTLSWLEGGEMILHGVRGPRFIRGQEFAAWEGLDGCQIPLFLHQPIPREMTLKETLAREVVLGRLGAPPLFVDLPDMIAVDDAWMAERRPVEFVRLDAALPERYKKSRSSGRARLQTHWSYLEGIRAEELSRSNGQAEQAALQAEALNALAYTLAGRPPDDTSGIWKTILKTQHHDVYCFSAPELRDKSIGWLQEAARQAADLSEQAARAILPQIHLQEPGRPSDGGPHGVPHEGPQAEPYVVFHSLPHPQTGWVELTTPVDRPAVFDSLGQPVPCAVEPAGAGASRVRFLADMPGLGYAAFWVRGGGQEPAPEQAVDGPVVFENPFYKAVIQPDGTFTSLTIQPGGQELIDSRRGAGNTLSATDSAGITLHDEPPEERLEHYVADPPVRGPWLSWDPGGPARLRRTALGVEFYLAGRLGERTRAGLTIRMAYRLPRIDLTWQFDFDQASLGTFFDDDSKLLARWPLAVQGTITHDIPFGVVQEPEERPFFPTRWVDISDGQHGLAFFHRGTPSHWVSGGTLFNLIAWGEDTDAIHNGLGRYQWPKAFDQRLCGRHTIHQAVLPHTGDWRLADLHRAARDYHTTLLAFREPPHAGSLPPSLTALALAGPEAEATSVQAVGDRVICRVYAAYGREVVVRPIAYGLREAGLRLISGEMVTGSQPYTLAAYQAGELLLERDLGQ